MHNPSAEQRLHISNTQHPPFAKFFSDCVIFIPTFPIQLRWTYWHFYLFTIIDVRCDSKLSRKKVTTQPNDTLTHTLLQQRWGVEQLRRYWHDLMEFPYPVAYELMMAPIWDRWVALSSGKLILNFTRRSPLLCFWKIVLNEKVRIKHKTLSSCVRNVGC